MNQPVKLLQGKLLLGVTAAGAVAGLAFFGWSAKAKSDATYQLANGVKVTPFIVKDEGLSQLLDAKVWKFDVALPDHTKSYDYNLVVYKHGKIIETVGGLETGPAPGGNPSQQRPTDSRHDALEHGQLEHGQLSGVASSKIQYSGLRRRD